jgi:hypothetical protein
MNDQTLLIGHILFWIFGSCTALLPLRWAIPFYLLAVQIDSSGPDLASASSLGFENSLKVIALPTLLLLRLGWKRYRDLSWPPLAKTWMFFLSYVALAALWSPFQLSAIKMVGYLYAYTVLFWVFTYAWLEDWLNEKVLAIVVFVALVLAVVQTHFLGNLFGFGGTENRFTTFSDTESFGAFLIALLSLVLFCTKDRVGRIVCAASLSLGIILTGSRYVFIGLILLFLIASIFYTLTIRSRAGFGLLLKGALKGLVPTLLLMVLIVEYLPQNRLNELTSLTHSQGVEEIGTFGFRLAIYGITLGQLADRNARQLVFGTGTSSGAEVALQYDPSFYTPETVDGNRIIHDEFLRALYEWGGIGLTLLVVLLVKTFKTCLDLFRRHKTRGAMAFLGIFPTILIGLAVGNVLSEAGFPGGTGFVLVLACAAASRFQPLSAQGQKAKEVLVLRPLTLNERLGEVSS